MCFKIEGEWLKDKAKLIGLGCILSPAFYYIMYLLVNKYQRLGSLFFSISFLYLLTFNWYVMPNIKKEKKKYFYIGLSLLVFYELIFITILGLVIYFFDIKWPKMGGGWFGTSILIIMIMLSYFIYNATFLFIKKKLKEKDKAKGIIELNKFQEKARRKIEEMLSDLDLKVNEFKKVEREKQIVLEGDINLKERLYLITIYEDAIALAAESEEEAFILELMDYESSNKLIDDFCKKAKEIFGMVN